MKNDNTLKQLEVAIYTVFHIFHSMKKKKTLFNSVFLRCEVF